MIDIHSHILPHVDDGAATWEDSLAMAELAQQSGVHVLVATPHCGLPGQDLRGRAELLQQRLSSLQEKLAQAGTKLHLLPGMEIFGTEDTALHLKDGLLTTLNGSRYPLIEFPFEHYARQATHILDDVLTLGYRPVVAHPERYLYVQADPTLLNLWTDMGCLFQVNRGSLLGRFGPTAEALSWSMTARNFVYTVASDAHSPHTRTTWMKDVEELLAEEFSAGTARRLLTDHPMQLLTDASVETPEPDWF